MQSSDQGRINQTGNRLMTSLGPILQHFRDIAGFFVLKKPTPSIFGVFPFDQISDVRSARARTCTLS